MRTAFLSLIGLLAVGSLAACDTFVQDVTGPIDRVVSDSLDNQASVGFLATGVEEGFNDAYDAAAVLADLLSDAGEFDQCVRNATFPTFGEIDRGEIPFDNNSVDGVYDAINEYRFLADDLLRRADETITFSGDEDGQEAERLARYTANLHGGIARYFLASYFGLNPTQGGAPINASAFIPSSQLYADAIAKLQAALGFAATDYERRVINSLIARTYLYAGDRGQAGTFAANGLVQGDAPLTGDYASTSANNWYTQGGRGRTQVSVAPRFANDGDPRTEVEEAPPANAACGNLATYYRQAMYTSDSDPMPFISWEETALIRAEVALLANSNPGVALGFVNAVRSSVGLADLATIDQATLLDERDKTLFTLGARLIDQRRFGLPFVYARPADTAAGTAPVPGTPLPGDWQYLPITQSERNSNPNL